MSNVVQFPRRIRAPTAEHSEPAINKPPPAPAKHLPKPTAQPVEGPRPTPVLITALWTVAVLLWPVLKWVVGLDLVYQIGRVAYYWHEPQARAGWMCLGHLSACAALVYFVWIYEPTRRRRPAVKR